MRREEKREEKKTEYAQSLDRRAETAVQWHKYDTELITWWRCSEHS